MDKAIETWGLTKKFSPKNVAVKNVYLRVSHGEALGIFGPPGSGKTTLLKILMGLQSPSSGGGFCLGYDLVTESMQIRENVGYVANEASLYDHLTIREMIKFSRNFYSHWNDELVPRYLEFSNLPTRIKIKKMTPEQKSLLALILALAPEPQLLLLDEPTLFFSDPAYRQTFEEIVNLEMISQGRTVVIASRLLDEIKELTEETVLIYKGKILTRLEVDRLLEDELPSDAEEICRMFVEEEKNDS